MDTYIINAQEYYLASSVKSTHKLLFRGCLSNMSKMITRHKLTNEYIYARKINGVLVESEGTSTKSDKLYLTKKWVDDKLVELGLVINDSIINNKEYAPDILELKDCEKLTDDDGNIYDIEVRGERHPDKVYFKVKDISARLNMQNLAKTLKHADTNYVEGEHYVKFCFNDETNFIHQSGELFLTCGGFMKVIYSSSNNKCDKFRKWATDVIFAAHLGTKPQKQELAAKLIGTDRKTVREVFSKSATSQSCIYLIYLGKAKDLATTFKIKDYEPNESIYKFGRSIDLAKRMDQHHAKYAKLGCKVELVKFAHIDPIYNNDAENDIKEYFASEGFIIKNKKYVELVKLSSVDLKLVKSKYEKISNEYMGHYTELNNKIKLMEKTCESIDEKRRADVAEIENKLLKQELKYKKKIKALKKQMKI